MNSNYSMQPVQENPLQSMELHVKQICEMWVSYHVIAHMKDGSRYDAILDGVDAEGVTLLLPEEIDAEAVPAPYRQYDFGRRRYRRFRRQRFPFFSFVFPFFVPFPYNYPVVPFNPYGFGTPAF